MAMSDQFFFKHSRPRPTFRLLYSILGIVIVATTAEFIAVAMPAPIAWMPRELTFLFWFRLLLLPVLLGLYALLSRVLEGRPPGSVGLAFHPRWKNELLLGVAAGAAMILLAAAAECLGGAASFSLALASPGRVFLAGIFFLVLLTVVAVDEELIFRGYPFQRLVEITGPVLAVLISSAVFGLAHFRNPFHTWISTLNTIVVGFLLAICYLRTHALWLPIGIHFAWNFVQGFVLGLPVSGVVFPDSILHAKISGPLWLTGGAYGPEGSILCLGVIAAGTVYFFVSRRIFTTGEMERLALGPGDEEGTASSLFSAGSVSTGKRE